MGVKDRITKNRRTTALGIALGVVATIALFTHIADMAEYGAFAPFWIGLLWAKDSILKANG